MKHPLLISLCLIAFFAAFAGQSSTGWQATFGPQKVFIENKGQFDRMDDLPGDILFGTEGNTNLFLFTRTGVTFRLEKPKVRKEDESELISEEAKALGHGNAPPQGEQEKDEDEGPQMAAVHMQWEGANPDAALVAEDEVSNYYNYQLPDGFIGGAHAFKKLVYRNLYPNIDVEYVFHPDEGLEYSLILHPGADISQVRMKYSGVDNVGLNARGEIHLPTVFGDIVDHAPSAFYMDSKGKTVSSSFVCEHKRVSFNIGDYDHSHTLVIDPWTVTPSMPHSNRVFYIKADSSGNAYIYGGDSPFNLQKYNSSGTLQWTYYATWDSSGTWFGALAVDRAGNSYITGGSEAGISKVNTSGIEQWLVNPNALLIEYWDMAFNCDQTKLIVGGTLNFKGEAFNIDLANGTYSSSLLVANTTPGFLISNPDELRTVCASPNGNYYGLTLDSIVSFTGNMTLNWRGSSGVVFAYGSPAYGLGTPQGQNAIRASASNIYTLTGAQLQKRDINTGAVLSTVTVPGGVTHSGGFGVVGTSAGNGGIDLDSCGNVYVGSTTGVYEYDENLNFITSASTTSAVFDVTVSTNGIVFACGQAYAKALSMNACPQVKTVCYTNPLSAQLQQSAPKCAGQCTGSATATPVNGTGPFAYAWNNLATSQTISSLCAGTYTVTITDQSNNNTATATTVISAPGAIVPLVSETNATCGNNNGTATASITSGGTGPFTYLWTGGSTSPGISNLGSGTYDVTITDANLCTVTGSAAVSQTGGITLTPSSNPATCGNNNGTASVSASGGTGYTYSWSNNGTSASISNIAGGTYTVTVTGTGNCTATASVSVSSTGAITLTPSSNPATCGNSNGSASVSASGGTGYTYAWSNTGTSATISNVASGVYTVTVTGTGNCTATASVSVSSTGGITLTPSSSAATCGSSNGTASVSASGGTGYTYSWSNTGTSATIIGLPDGLYTVTVTGTGNCTATASVSVSSSSAITLTPVSSATTCGNHNGSAGVTASGGSTYTYFWSNDSTSQIISNLAPGTYTVTVTSGGCTSTATASVATSAAISVTTTSTPAGCTPIGTATANASGGSSYSYHWSNGATTDTATNLPGGTYTVTVTSNGCSATASATVATSGGGITLLPVSHSATCGNSNGSAAVSVTTGTGPFTYLWSNNGTTDSISNLSPGSYSVTVNGSGGCVTNTIIQVVNTGSITAAPTGYATSCGVNNGSASVSASGGNGVYTYAWSNNGNTDSISNLPAGTYSVTVSDNTGCSTSASASVASSTGTSVTATTNKTIMCSGDSATICASGINLISYAWSSGDTTQCIVTPYSGNYYVSATASGGCSAVSNHVNVGIYTPTPVTISENGDTLTSYSAVTYQWYFNGQPLIGDTTPSIIAAQAGVYKVVVTDANGCAYTSLPTTIKLTGIGGISGANGISVYPNPLAAGSWHLDVPDGLVGSVCEVFDADGKKVYSGQVRSIHSEIYINAAEGVYMLRIYSVNANYNVKLIKMY